MRNIRIPTPLRAYTEGQREIHVDAEDVGTALSDLIRQYPALASHIYGDAGELRPYINLLVNDEYIRTLEGQETAIGEGDTLMILPSIAGGAAGAKDGDLKTLDHTAMRTSMAIRLGVLLAAFIGDTPGLIVMAAGCGSDSFATTCATRRTATWRGCCRASI